MPAPVALLVASQYAPPANGACATPNKKERKKKRKKNLRGWGFQGGSECDNRISRANFYIVSHSKFSSYDHGQRTEYRRCQALRIVPLKRAGQKLTQSLQRNKVTSSHGHKHRLIKHIPISLAEAGCSAIIKYVRKQIVFNPLIATLKPHEQRTVIQQYSDWYTGR